MLQVFQVLKIIVQPAQWFEFDMPVLNQSNSYNQMPSKSDDIKLLSLFQNDLLFLRNWHYQGSYA